MFSVELSAYHLGTFGGVYPSDRVIGRIRWVHVDRIFTVQFETVRAGAEVAKPEAGMGGTLLVRDTQSICLVRDYLQADQARRRPRENHDADNTL